MSLAGLPEQHYLTLERGLTLHYLDHKSSLDDKSPLDDANNTGTPVIWLHGSGPGASGYSNFKGNYPEFSQAGFRNLILDLPGFGRSDKPADVHYNLDFFVGVLNEFIQKLALGPCILLGNSLGGAIALGQTLAHPETVSRLILMAPGGVEERETYFQMEGIQRMVATYNQGPMGMQEMREVMSLQLYDSSALTDELLAERVAVAQHQPAQLFSTMMVPNMTERLPEITVPVLGFWGTNDLFNPPEGMFKFLHKLPQSRFLMLNQCGHWVQVEHEDLFNRTCLDFLLKG